MMGLKGLNICTSTWHRDLSHLLFMAKWGDVDVRYGLMAETGKRCEDSNLTQFHNFV